MKLSFFILFAFSTVLAPLIAVADASSPNPYLDPIFKDHMVLQRGIGDPIWGWTNSGATVTVSVAGKSVSAKAGADGAWRVNLPELLVGGPYDLTVEGPQAVTLHDVLVGDVWVCSGQSNMEFGIGNGLNSEQEIAAANYPQIRLFTVPKQTSLIPKVLANGQWQVCTPDSIKEQGTWNGFSAVGYFFGRDLNQKLNIPIGLIQSSWGGTPAEAWTSDRNLSQKLAEFKPAMSELLEAREAARAGKPVAMTQLVSEWYGQNDPGAVQGWEGLDFDDSKWQTMSLPNYFEFVGDPDLVSFHGIIWFRKEVDLPDGLAGKDAILHLYADDNDTTWVNGKQVGYTEGYQDARSYAVSGGLLHPGRNFVAVRVLDTGGLGGIYGKSEQLTLEFPGAQTVPLAGPWLYRKSTNLNDLPITPMDPANPSFPTVLYNGMISPIAGFGIKGVIWYQGENNAGRAYQYRTLLPTLIADWRQHWGEGAFPFYIVQLANWQTPSAQPGEDNWAELREAQFLTAAHVQNSGLAVTIDIGDPNDIHPKNKQEVGRRLSLVALAKSYGEKISYSGPVYKSMKVESASIRLYFTDLEGGLVAKGGSLTGFAIAGSDRKFVWADAKIDGNTVVVSSQTVAAPTEVRYAWSINPVCDLYNEAGLPAVPFRTDNWPGITFGVK